MKRISLFLIITFLLVLSVKEVIEPQIAYLITDMIYPAKPKYGFSTGKNLFYLFDSPFPHNGKIASVQKGLVWMKKNGEVVGEGFGFGVPLVYLDQVTYASQKAIVFTSETDDRMVRKRFFLDCIHTNQWLVPKYKKVNEIGYVDVTYRMTDDQIEMFIDQKGLKKKPDKIFIMCEQSGDYFDTFHTADGKKLHRGEIPSWQETVPPTRFHSKDHSGFGILTRSGSERILFGREVKTYWRWSGPTFLDWAGFDLELPGNQKEFHFTISIYDSSQNR